MIDMCGQPCKLYVVYKYNTFPFVHSSSLILINIPVKFLFLLSMKVGQSLYPIEITNTSLRLPRWAWEWIDNVW